MEQLTQDFLRFKKMVTPIIIQILFWIGVVTSVIVGIVLIVGGVSGRAYGGGTQVFLGILWLLLGPVIARIWCEVLIVLFSINDTLTEIKNLLKKGNTETKVS
jgi:hypothetical protein